MKERAYGYDNLKFLLILAVVMGHLINSFTDESDFFRGICVFIYSFHMPLFIFVSGLFQKPYKKGSLDVNRIISFCMIGFLAKMLMFTWGTVVGRNPKFEMFGQDGIPWFMFVLAVYMVLMYLLRDVKLSVLLVFAVVMGCFAGYDKNLGDFLYLSRIFVYFPFYVLGYHLEPQQVLDFAQKKVIKIAAIVCIIVMIFVCTEYTELIYKFRPLLTGRNPFSENMLAHGGAFLRLFCYGLTCCMGVSLISLIPKKRLSLISVWGQRTLAVYFWHQCIIKSLIHFGISDKIFTWGIVGKIILIIIPVVVTMFLSLRIFSVPLDYIMKNITVKKAQG